MSARIDTVVFDLGNVLIPWNIQNVLGDYFDSAEALAAFLREIDFPSWHAQQDAGYPVAQAVADHSAKFPHHAKVISAFYERWNETVGPVIEESAQMLESLRAAGLRCYALSNFSAELFAQSKPLYDFWPHFEGIVLSGEEGVNKPDARIYQVLFERHAIDPARAVFIDDSLPNVLASRALGMRAVHFRAASEARLALRGFGLPV
jgi:2-haloacid dehalogenase